MDIEWAARMSDLNENFTAILREHDEDGIGESARLYDRIDRAFNLFSCGDGFGAAQMKGFLADAKYELIKDRNEDFRGIDTDMSGWQGAAASQFLTYVNRLDDGISILIDRIETMQMILQAHEVLVKAMRQDVCDLVQKTLDGVAAAESDGWEVGMTVAGAVAAFVGGLALGGLPPWAVMGLVASQMGAGAAGVAVAVRGAEDELGVLVNFVDSAEGMLHSIDIERLRIEKGFRSLAQSITGQNLVEVRPERPVIVTAPSFDPKSFGMQDQMQAGHPVPTDTRDLVPEPKKREDGPFDKGQDDHDRYQEQGPA
ncbi:MAG: hypothetical protein M3422_00010 [Actinomycetota bacterium]|nr:hypothetical protein [Actinomycetota bacterium]